MSALIAWLITRTGLGKLAATAVLYAAIAFAAIGAGWGGWAYIKHLGKEDLQHAIDRQNADAASAAEKARRAIDDACRRDPAQCLRDDWTRHD